ncbi:MAG TPA: tetratricopeptide repeat protein [Planctomycetes bacterium]|nr:tetratricopeptide repeat protein [Planctomycetota bacterium]
MPPPAATMSAAPSVRQRRNLWIDGPLRDLAFYIATPLLLLPFVFLRLGRPGIEELLLYAGAFGALGHHLPGMMRAYGDRRLFQRFRVRFLLAPLFLVPICIFFSVRNLEGVLLVTFFWTNWHSMMQVFGFARIYDAKVGSVGRLTGILDQGLCLAWFAAPLALSDSRFGALLEMWYETGGPLVSHGFVAGLRGTLGALLVVATAAWVLHTLLLLRRGVMPSPAKLALFVTSFGFWWFCMAVVDNLLLGIALFNIFHDVQYLALVWTFNRARVERDPEVGGFSRLLFRNRATLVGVYVGLVVAYGSLGFFGEKISSDFVRQTVLGILAASALLHFYFDGFIWKVREHSIREGLQIEGGKDIRLGGLLPGWAVHGSKWSMLVVPLGLFYHWEVQDQRPEMLWRQAVVEAVPESAEALTALGASLDVHAEPERVLELHREAIARKPTYPVAHNNYGVAQMLLGDTQGARRSFERALELFPRYSVAHRHLGMLLAALGEGASAEEHLRRAVDLDPRDGRALAALGATVARRGETLAAKDFYERALRFAPEERTALNGLAWILATHPDPSLRDGARAVELAEHLDASTNHSDPIVLDTLAAAYMEAGRGADALDAIQHGLSLAREAPGSGLAPVLERHFHSFASGDPWRGGR